MSWPIGEGKIFLGFCPAVFHPVRPRIRDTLEHILSPELTNFSSQISALQNYQSRRFQALEDRLISITQHLKTISSNTCQIESYAPNFQYKRCSKSVTKKRTADCYWAQEKSYWLLFGNLNVRSILSRKNEIHDDEWPFQRTHVRFRPVYWASHRGFEVLSEKLYGSWQYSFQSYRMITEEDPI